MRNNEIAEQVTANILAALESGKIPWVQPWKNSGATVAMNITTGKSYRGINTLILYLAQLQGSYGLSRWLTFNQAKAKGGMVRKGEKGTRVVFWKFLEKENKAGEKSKFPMCRVYTVFNVAQCDGLPEDFTTMPEVPPVTDRNEAIDAFIQATGAKITFGGDRACYSPALDEINMPEMGQFVDAGGYYATILHELCHWTGHESRCKRQLGQRFGRELYAAEELVAELGSAFLCAELGVQGRLQHAAYVQNWIQVLKSDPKAIFTASSMAQEAADYLRAKSRPLGDAGTPEAAEEVSGDDD